MLDYFYELITEGTIDIRDFGEKRLKETKNTSLGFLGVAVQDTSTLLIGLQNIVALNLGKPTIRMNIGSPKTINDPNDLFSAMKSIHRYFFISVQTAIESGSLKICKRKMITCIDGEKAFIRAMRLLNSNKKKKWETFYKGLKILRNNCAHPNFENLNEFEVQKINDAGLDF